MINQSRTDPPSGSTLSSFTQPIAAIVTGAARGIGLALVIELLENDRVVRVFATCRSKERAGRLIELAGRYPARLVIVTMDITDEASVRAASGAVAQTGAAVNLLIHCIGVLHDDTIQPERRLQQIDPDAMLKSFQVNAVGTALVAKHFAQLIDQSQKSVFASLSARVASIGDNHLGGWYSYRASKAALNMIIRTCSIELQRKYSEAICIALHPGSVDTDLSKPFQRGIPPGKLFPSKTAAQQLLTVIDGLTLADNGGFFAWDSQPIDW